MEPILSVRELTKTFSRPGQGKQTAVNGVSFDLRPGERLGIIGESGSGKTTVANLVTRLLDADGGRILLDGEDITSVTGRDLRRVYRKIQMVFQTPAESFDPRRTLGDGVGESLRGLSRREARQEAVRLMERCGLPGELARRYPHEVSGGQCQRAAIARALAMGPKVLICDEATSALDVSIQKKIVALLTRLQKEKNIAMIFICHDMALVQSLSHRLAVMYLGNIVETVGGGELCETAMHPYTQALLGSVFSLHMDCCKKIETIPGDPPSPLELPPGCPFAGRCEKRMPVCKAEKPRLKDVAPGHQVACHLY